MSVRIRVRDEQLQTFLYAEPEKEEAILAQWREEGGAETRRVMRQLIPLGKSFMLRESVTTVNTPRGFTTYPDIDYAKYVDKDTRPHIIRPRNAKALRWFGQWGQPIFAKQVHHPGTKGQHFIRRTAEQCRGYLADLWRFIWLQHH